MFGSSMAQEPTKKAPPKYTLPKLKVMSPEQCSEEPAAQAEPQDSLQPPNKPPGGPPAALAPAEPEPRKSPFRRHSLLGMADEIEAGAAATKPLLGSLVMQGQATMIYADPNAGKTLATIRLVLDAIEARRVGPDQVYYINADDSSEGLAVKLRLFQDVGVHVLAPGFNGFRTDDLVKLMLEAIADGSARGVCIIVDTYKKFTDLMDKRRTTECNKVVRQWVMAGGTFLALGHTKKQRNPDGTPEYQGTTDVLEDFDAVYVGQVFAPKDEGSHSVVRFKRRKSRADSPEAVAYAYLTKPGTSYAEKLASVELVDPDDLKGYSMEVDVSEGLVLAAICRLLQAGFGEGKMALAKAAARETGISHRAALEILERYTGVEPGEHLWNYDKGPRGVRIYRLIDQTKASQ